MVPSMEVGIIILTLGLRSCSPWCFLASIGHACRAQGCWRLRYGQCSNPGTGCPFPTGALPACTGPWQHKRPLQSSDPVFQTKRNTQYVNIKQQLKRKHTPSLMFQLSFMKKTWSATQSYLYGPIEKFPWQFLQRNIASNGGIIQPSKQSTGTGIPNNLWWDGDVKNLEIIK